MYQVHLVWLAFAVGIGSAHPTRGTSSRVNERAALLDSYRLNTLSTYTTLDQDSGISSTAEWKRDGDVDEQGNGAVPYYVQAATSQVQKIVPGASFRVVDDYYVGTNNVGHVHFQQIIDGFDVDNAYFKINVSWRVALQS